MLPRIVFKALRSLTVLCPFRLTPAPTILTSATLHCSLFLECWFSALLLNPTPLGSEHLLECLLSFL